VSSKEHLHDVEDALWIWLVADREGRPLQCGADLDGNVDAFLQPGHILDRPGLRKDRIDGGSHAIALSQPDKVTAVILEALQSS
jgi:hypothetical protein